ncbi:hypothetical protein EC973_004132 [Apophysomyces ossiformis]|uniref:Uncharacterized protein n=1 Tax=Apophysomyces ossiformis TaxID=679940 RepID=A0A8H7BLL9_9FUNG|nr:hypothetical protein EC973_004132 [Apophysomyces ossiformis]
MPKRQKVKTEDQDSSSILSGRTVYIVTEIYSPYKEDVDDDSISTHVCSDHEEAKKLMRQLARQLYEDNELNEGSKPFFYEGDNSILFGEDEDYGATYRRGWGLIKVEKAVIDGHL